MAADPLSLEHDEARFEQLYREYAADVYRYALAIMRNPADAEDVTQATFLNAWRAFSAGEEPRAPLNWFISIAHNVCRLRFRTSSRRPREVEFEPALAEAPTREGPTAADVLEALAELPLNQRAALVMRELEGRSYGEIASILGVSRAAVETLIFRARRSLRVRRDAVRALAVLPLPQSLASFFRTHAAVEAGAGVGLLGGVAAKVVAVVAAGAVATGVGIEAVRADAPPAPSRPVPPAAVAPSEARPAAAAPARAERPRTAPSPARSRPATTRRSAPAPVTTARRGQVAPLDEPVADRPAAAPPANEPAAPQRPSETPGPAVSPPPAVQPPAAPEPRQPAVPALPAPPPVEVPTVDVPSVDVPPVDVPPVDVPPVQAPVEDLPPVDLPPVDVPPVDVPPVDLPPVRLPTVELPPFP